MMARAVVPHMLRAGTGPGHHRHHQPGDDGAGGLPALRLQQGGGRVRDGGAGGGPEGHGRDGERAWCPAGSRIRRSSATTPAIARKMLQPEIMVPPLLWLVSDAAAGSRRGASSRRTGTLAARRAGGGESRRADRVAGDRADADRAGVRIKNRVRYENRGGQVEVWCGPACVDQNKVGPVPVAPTCLLKPVVVQPGGTPPAGVHLDAQRHRPALRCPHSSTIWSTDPIST